MKANMKRDQNYILKTLRTSGISMLSGLAFLVYNGVLGSMYGAAWNISISIYYAILFVLRLRVLAAASGKDQCSEKSFMTTYIILGLMDVALIAPVMDMALGHRDYTFGLIPAIAMAAYTTYRIVTAVMHYLRSRKTYNIFILELRTFNLIDALAAVLTLQNALIIANGGFDAGLRKLVLYTSAGILLIMFAVTISSYRKGRSAFYGDDP